MNRELRARIFAAERNEQEHGTIKAARIIGSNGHAIEEEIQSAIKERVLSKPSHSLAHWSKQPINHTQTLLGNRFLCNGGGFILGAPAGVGKSTAAINAAVLWSAGLPAFDLKPARALRILIVQAEDDEGDIIEMCQIVNKIGLTTEQQNMVDQNTLCIQINDFYGSSFIKALDYRLEAWPGTNLVIINPLNSFSGCDPTDTQGMMEFLRQGLNPLLTKHKCAVLPVHHSPKTRNWDTDKWKPHEFVYAISGNNEISNWCRAMIYIDPTYAHDTFKFIAAKRGKRSGWQESGSYVYTKYFSHSTDGLIWRPSTEEQIAEAEQAKKDARKKNGSKPKFDNDVLLAPLCSAEGVKSYTELHTILVRTMGKGAPDLSTVNRRWNKWIEDGLIVQNESGSWIRAYTHGFKSDVQ